MLFSDAITRVRGETFHDADTQFEDTQLLPVLVAEYRRLCRWMCTFVPSLREAVQTGIVVAEGANTIAKSGLTNFDRVLRVERLEESTYYPIGFDDGIRSSNPCRLSWREQPAQLLLSPSTLAPGTYQVVFAYGAPAPATLITSSEVDLPDELFEVLIERGCGWARQRHNESVAYHAKRAEDLLVEAQITLRKRCGQHGKSGLRREGAGAWRR